MHEPTPIVFYTPRSVANGLQDESFDGDTVDTAALLAAIGATDVDHRHADLHTATWAGLDVMASAQVSATPGGDELVRLVIELASMDWIEMRMCNPDGTLVHPERTRRLIEHFGAAADALECEVAFKSMTVLPDGWANWDIFLPDFDRIASHRSARELVGESVDFGYAADGLEGVEWETDDDEAGDGLQVYGAVRGARTARGTIWFGDRLPVLTATA